MPVQPPPLSKSAGSRIGRPLQETAAKCDVHRLVAPLGQGWSGARVGPWSYKAADPQSLIEKMTVALDLHAPHSGSLVIELCLAGGRQTAQTFDVRGTKAANKEAKWSALCPSTGRWVRTLYLAPGNETFASMQASGLVYRSQRRSRVDRLFTRYYKIADELGGGLDARRPAGMSEQRYEKLKAALGNEYLRILGGVAEKYHPDLAKRANAALEPVEDLEEGLEPTPNSDQPTESLQPYTKTLSSRRSRPIDALADRAKRIASRKVGDRRRGKLR